MALEKGPITHSTQYPKAHNKYSFLGMTYFILFLIFYLYDT